MQELDWILEIRGTIVINKFAILMQRSVSYCIYLRVTNMKRNKTVNLGIIQTCAALDSGI